MNLSQIKTRLGENNPARHEARYVELRAFVCQEKEKYGVRLIEHLPHETQKIIDEMGWDLKTPGELSAELDVLNRELESLALVRELERRFFLPDPRDG